MSWEQDPEMRALREEFIDSLMDRLHLLRAAQSARQIGEIAHKLAGVAGSYGFKKLGEIASLLEDWIDSHGEEPVEPGSLRRFSALLETALDQAQTARNDPSALAADPVFAELIYAVESRSAAASSESS